MRGFTMIVVVAVSVVVSRTVQGQNLDGDDYGVGLLNTILEQDPSGFCKYVQCQENTLPSECPEGTSYLEGTAQFGCCGACIHFKQENDEHCTGSIDPKYGGGYNTNVKKTVFLNSLTRSSGSVTISLPDNTNVLSSSWCDFNLICDPGQSKCAVEAGKQGCQVVLDLYLAAKSDPEPDPVTHFTSEKYIQFRDDYRWGPTCTDDGYYAEKQCKGPYNEQRCICVDPGGNRIFGSTFDFQEELFESMNCKCSRRVWEMKEAGASSVTLHCQENGNYEPLQCDDGWCYCIDPDTAEVYGPSMPESGIRLLPCYNKTTTGEKYLRRCESEFYAHAELKDLLQAKGVKPPTTQLNCDEDGSYGPKQWTGKMFACKDKYNTQLSAPGDGRCECRRDEHMFAKYGISQDLNCDPTTGRYPEFQSRGNTIYCVDEDGVRMGPMVYTAYGLLISCKEAESCQRASVNCQHTCDHCPPEAYANY